MANETDVRPALTAEEWKEPRLDRSDLCAYTADDLLVCYTPGDRSTLASGEDRHALAALALHDEPFGFTREDVAILEQAALVMENEDVWGEPDSRSAAAYRSLAARIEALLPPHD